MDPITDLVGFFDHALDQTHDGHLSLEDWDNLTAEEL